MNMKRFAASADSETDKNIWETVEDAYVYAFLLVEYSWLAVGAKRVPLAHSTLPNIRIS